MKWILPDIDEATVNALFCSLAKIATAKTDREILLEDMLRTARTIAARNGKDTGWRRFDRWLAMAGITGDSVQSFHLMPDETEDFDYDPKKHN